jgi:hypothetical protein
MQEEFRVLLSNFDKPCEGPVPIALQFPVTELDPFSQDRIEHLTYTDKSGPSESAVVIQPASYTGIAEFGQFLQLATCPFVQFPGPDFIPDCLFRFSANGGREAHKELSLAIFRKPGFERKSQEIEFRTCILFLPVRIFAVDNLCLFRMYRQSTFFQSIPYGFEKLFSFQECPAMNDNIIGIPGKRICRMLLLHPFIEGVM